MFMPSIHVNKSISAIKIDGGYIIIWTVFFKVKNALYLEFGSANFYNGEKESLKKIYGAINKTLEENSARDLSFVSEDA